MTANFISTVNSLLKMEFDVTETLKWLTANRSIYWSWGVPNGINISNKALVLKVAARRHKGYVVITLGFDDTYTVSLVTTTGRIIETITDVYCDCLVETIDNKIEYNPNYAN